VQSSSIMSTGPLMVRRLFALSNVPEKLAE
jgi:hypothetical protein